MKSTRMLAVCKKCGLPLSFRKRGNGKLEPCNPDGSDHWDICRETQLKDLSSGRRYHKGKKSGYYEEGFEKDDKRMAIARTSPEIVGRNYKPDQIEHDSPPWE